MWYHFVFSIITLLIPIFGAYGQESSGVKITTELGRYRLVHAQSIAEDNTRLGYRDFTLRIDHVFCGPPELQDIDFIDSSKVKGVSSRGGTVFPSLEIGQHGLWLLYVFDDKGTMYRYRLSYLGIQWPVRFQIEKRYEQVFALAEAVEMVWNAPLDEKQQLVEEYALDPTPEISRWAIELMAVAIPEVLKEHQTKLASNDSIPLSGRLALDRALVKLEPEKWMTSRVRYQHLRRWIKSIESDDDGMQMYQHFDQMRQRHQIDLKRVLDLLEEAIENENFSDEIQRLFVGFIVVIVRHDEKFRERGMGMLVTALTQEEHEFLSSTAAEMLRFLEPFEPLERNRLLVSLTLAEQTHGAKNANYKKLHDILQPPPDDDDADSPD